MLKAVHWGDTQALWSRLVHAQGKTPFGSAASLGALVPQRRQGELGMQPRCAGQLRLAGGQEQEVEDDGFLDALNAEASGLWGDTGDN